MSLCIPILYSFVLPMVASTPCVLAAILGFASVAALPSRKLAEQPAILSLDSKHGSDATCVANTGGLCVVQNCFDWRGNTTCSSGHCLCQDSSCAGADGKCYAERNELVASGFRLRNAQWADYLLHFPIRSNAMKVHNTENRVDGSDLFDLHGLAGSNRTRFLLGSTAHPGHVSAALAGGMVGIMKTIANKGIDKLGVKLMRAPAFEGQPSGSVAVMIAPIQEHLRHSYYTVTPSSLGVGLWPQDPGVGSYWLVEPASALKHLHLPEFDGRACRRYCGFYNSGTSTQGKSVTTTLYGLLGLSVFGPCLIWFCMYLVNSKGVRPEAVAFEVSGV